MRWLTSLRPAGTKALALAALALTGVTGLKAQVAYINEYSIPTPNSYPHGIAAAPDGALWFAEAGQPAKIGRITTSGAITEYPLPLAYSRPQGITAGPDGALWFAGGDGDAIGRITTTGTVTEYSAGYSGGITTGPDGALWFTEPQYYNNRIGRITTAGVITEYSIPTVYSMPGEIAAGPDGALWFTEYNSGKIGRITTDGIITEYPTPTYLSAPSGITAGPDGALWFTESGYPGKIGRITTDGAITEYPTPTPLSQPFVITVGPEGALWFTEYYANQIGRITTAGVISEYLIPTQSGAPLGIAAGPDGNIWFAEDGTGKIGQVVLSVPPKPPTVSCAATPNTLWPPNGSSVPVTISGIVIAGTSALASGGTGYTVNDEYGQVQPSGSVALGADGSYSFAVSLIAARNGNDKDGRTYTIVVNSQDISGKVGSCSAVVTVPHDQGN